jgi:hypothetical protein
MLMTTLCFAFHWMLQAALRQLQARRPDVAGRSMFEKQLMPVVQRGRRVHFNTARMSATSEDSPATVDDHSCGTGS